MAINQKVEVLREVVDWMPVVGILALFGIVVVLIITLNVISGVEGESMISKLFRFDNKTGDLFII